MTRRISLPVREYLLQTFDYRDGKLYWASNGKAAGYCHQRYHYVQLDGASYLTHRIVWRMFYGSEPATIDHIDGDSFNNRIDNLRECTSAQNNWNACKWGGKALPKGVSTRHGGSTFRARIQVNGKTINLGDFKTPDEAHCAYLEAAKEHHGPFARAA